MVLPPCTLLPARGLSFEQARKLAAEVRPRVTTAGVEPFLDRREEYRVHVHNWHTDRSAHINQRSDVDVILDFLGPLDPDKPRGKPEPYDEWGFRWCG